MAGFSSIRDQDRTVAWWGLSSVDGVMPVQIKIDSATGGALMEFGTSISAVMSHIPETLPRDENRISCLGGVSSSNPRQILPVSVNPATGAILVQTM